MTSSLPEFFDYVVTGSPAYWLPLAYFSGAVKQASCVVENRNPLFANLEWRDCL